MYLSTLIVSACCALIIGNQFVACKSDKSDSGESVQQIKEGKQKWKEVVDESTQSNRELSRFQPPVTNIPNEESLRIRARARGQTTGELPFLTGTLLAWITTQTENIVEELEAIAKDNAQSNVLNIKNYVRYLYINSELGVIAGQPIDELRWVKKKYDIFAGAFESARSVVKMWLHNRETELHREEAKELTRDNHHIRFDGPTKKWIRLYEDINYVATQVALPRDLIELAQNMLNKSPGGSDRTRSIRYMAINQSFN